MIKEGLYITMVAPSMQVVCIIWLRLGIRIMVDDFQCGSIFSMQRLSILTYNVSIISGWYGVHQWAFEKRL